MKTRAEIKDAGDGVVIEVRDQRSWFRVVFLLVWLSGWGFFEVVVIAALFTGPKSGDADAAWWAIAFFVVWLTFWTLGGIMAMRELLRMLTGRWVITFNGKVLAVRHKILGMGRTRSYET